EGEEWKVMGLAAYGKPRKEIYNFFRDRIKIAGLRLNFPELRRNSDSWDELAEICGGFRGRNDPDILRSADLAHNFQLCFEDVLCELVESLGQSNLSRNLAVAGGCAQNSSAMGKLIPRAGFNRLHVPSAPGDAGNALGVALYEKYAVADARRVPAV